MNDSVMLHRKTVSCLRQHEGFQIDLLYQAHVIFLKPFCDVAQVNCMQRFLEMENVATPRKWLSCLTWAQHGAAHTFGMASI